MFFMRKSWNSDNEVKILEKKIGGKNLKQSDYFFNKIKKKQKINTPIKIE